MAPRDDDHAAARLPDSQNLLFKRLVDPASGTLKSAEELRSVFASAAPGVDLSTPGFKFVSYCVTGTTACSLALAAAAVAEEGGIDGVETAVYDGSMQEWMARGGRMATG